MYGETGAATHTATAMIPGRQSRPELLAARLADWSAATHIPATTPITERMTPAATMALETVTGRPTGTAMAHITAVTVDMAGTAATGTVVCSAVTSTAAPPTSTAEPPISPAA